MVHINLSVDVEVTKVLYLLFAVIMIISFQNPDAIIFSGLFTELYSLLQIFNLAK